MARVNKFASVNLNDLFGKKEPAVKTAVNAPGSGGRPKGASHGMLVLTRPVKQPIKIGSGSTANLKKETSESIKPTATDITISGQSSISQTESANVGLVKDNPKPASAVDKSDVYVPPSLRGLHSTSLPSASVKLEPVPVEKTAVLSGEEFPSLQASLTTANINVQQQQSKDNQLDSKEQLEKLHNLSLQAQSRSCLNDVTQPDLNRFEPQRPQFFRPSLLRGNEQITLEKPETVTEKPDGYLSRNPSLLGNDESANSFENRLSSAKSVSGIYGHRVYQREGLSKESPNHGSICPPDLAQPNCGVIQREEQAETEIMCNKSMYSPPSKGGRYEREEFPRPGSGESRYYERETFPQPDLGESRCYERETFPQSGSGGSRYCEREAFPRPGSGGSRYYEREAFPRPGSGGSRYYETEAFPRPGSGGSRYHEREAFPRPGSGGSRYEREALPRPGSGGNRYNQEVFPRPRSGGNRYEREALSRPRSGGSRYQREVLPRPGSGGSRYESEALHQPGSDGSRFHREGLPRPGSFGSSSVREGLLRPGSGGSRYEREGLPQSGLDGSRFNKEASTQPISGGSRSEREVLLRPGSGGSRSEREVLPRSGSGGSRFNQEVLIRPESGGSRYGRGALPRSDSSGASCERGVFPRPGSGGSRYELKVLSQSASGGSEFEKQTLGHPNSVGGMHEVEALSISGNCFGCNEYSNDRGVISSTTCGGGNYARSGSGGSEGRNELILPESVDVYCTQPGFNGGGGYVQPNSGGPSYEREVMLRPGSGNNKYSRPIHSGMGGNGRIDGRELYKGSYFNGRQNYQRRETKSLMHYADGQDGNIHNAYEFNRGHMPFRQSGKSGELHNKDNYHGRQHAIVDSYGRDGAHDSEKW